MLLELVLAVPATFPRDAGAQVNNGQAFNTGAGNTQNSNDLDSSNYASDTYNCYYGGWQNFPPKSQWLGLDTMFNANWPAMRQGCGNLGLSPQDTDTQIQMIWNSIQIVSERSLVDHRLILAIIMQEV
jgi:hypothetical protein